MKQSERLQNLKDLSADQLDDQLVALKKEQFNLRFQQATGQLENLARIREVRRDIARVKTLSNQHKTAEKAGNQEQSDTAQ